MTARMAEPDIHEALLQNFAAGEVEASRRLIASLAPRLLAFSTRMLGDKADAEDVVQETFLRLWRIAPDWRAGEARVSTWAFRVASNLAIDRLRRTGRMEDIAEAPEPLDETPAADARLVAAERAAALDAALLRLPARQRQAVVLRHIEGMANPEVAATMEISVEAVESLTARGKRGLRDMLMPQKEGLTHDE
jgi:RNA polymerase sigma-70 factor (ECF subfamily)